MPQILRSTACRFARRGAVASAALLASTAPAMPAVSLGAGLIDVVDLTSFIAIGIGVAGAAWAIRERRARDAALDAANEFARDSAAIDSEWQTVVEGGFGSLVVLDGQQVLRVVGSIGGERLFGTLDDVLATISNADFNRFKQLTLALCEHAEPFSEVVTLARKQDQVRITGTTAGPFALLHVARPGIVAGEPPTLDGLIEMLDAAPFPVWRCDPDNRLVWVNQAYVDAVGSESRETVCVRDERIAPATGSGRDPLRALTRQALETGERQRSQAIVVVRGARRSFEVTEVPVPGGTVGFAQDLTGLHEMEDELGRHVRAHAETLDSISTGIAIFGSNQRLSFYNEAFAKLFALEPAWLDGSPADSEVLERLRATRKLPEQRDFREWKQKRLDLYTTVIESHEEVWHLPDKRMLKVTARPHPMGGLVFIYEDVTDQYALQTSYNALAGVHRATLESLAEGVAVFGTDGNLKLSNPAFAMLWNLDPEWLKNGPHVTVIAEKCEDSATNNSLWEEIAYRATSIGEKGAPLGERMTLWDGRVLDCSSRNLPDGALMLAFVDVTDSASVEKVLREKNEALEAADRLKAEFLSHISYELRVPLNTIMGYAQMLQDQMFGELNQRQADQVGHIMGSSEQLMGLINNILDLVTMEAGQLDLRTDAIPVQEAIEGAVSLFRSRAEDQSLTLSVEVQAGLPEIRADEARLRQVLVHLLSNALKYTSAGGRVAVSARRDGGNIAISVADTGIGMTESLQQIVFGHFATGRHIAEGGRRADGAGLGLALVKRIVEVHGGVASLVSTVGEGTTVTVSIPAAVPAALPRTNQDVV